MKELKKHITIFSRFLLRSRFYYLYVGVIYIGFGCYDKFSTPFMETYEDYIFRYNGQQYYMILTIIFYLILFMKEDFFTYYRNVILLHVKNEKIYFHALFLTVYLYNLVPFAVINLIVFVGNGLKSGYYPGSLFCVASLVAAMEMAAALLLGIGLFIMIKKSLLVFLSWFLIIEVLISTGNVFLSLPLTFGIVQNQGYYFTFAAPLFIGRIMILLIAWAVYRNCLVFFRGTVSS